MGASIGRHDRLIRPLERRTFPRDSLIGATTAGLGGFALSSLGFLWPRLGDALTEEVRMGDANQLVEEITTERAPLRVPAAGSLVAAHLPLSDGGSA